MTTPPAPREQPSRRLSRLLRAQITSGALAPGEQLPSERQLATEHDVARNTAREAVRLLADEGLVTVEHGRGAFVREQPRLMRFGSSRYSESVRERTGLSPYRAEVEAQGLVPHVECTSITKVEAPASVAERLELPEGATVIRRENHYFADGMPTQVGVTYIPEELAGTSALADSTNLGVGSIYARFAELGHSITKTREELSARNPSPEEVALLAIPDGVPVLDLIHTGIDQEGRPFEVTTFLMRADLFAVDYTMDIEP